MRLSRIAAKQHGAFTRQQALSSGIARSTIARRLANGLWVQLYAGVYASAAAPKTWPQSLMAACLVSGPSAVVSHRAAARLWQLPGFESPIVEISVPRSCKKMGFEAVHRQRSLLRADVTALDTIPVTTAARTLVDIAGCVDLDVLEEALDDALRRGLTRLPQVRRSLERAGTRGRTGSRGLQQLLSVRDQLNTVPHSVFETRLLRHVRAAKLPRPKLQFPVDTEAGRCEIDFAYPEQLVGIEADGFRWHTSRRKWDRDVERRNALAMLGWTVLYVTWPQLRDTPGDVLRRIAVLLVT